MNNSTKGKLNELALFCGGGGGLLASKLLGWNTICACEIESYPRNTVMQRQRDGIFDDFPIWDDIKTFDGKPWRGLVDIISGGFPCQDISATGSAKGLAGERSGLWYEYLRIIEEVRPQYVFPENSPLLRTRGLATVIKGLTDLGYDCRWGVLGAWHVGAPHSRNRIWIVAHSKKPRLEGHGDSTAEPPKRSWQGYTGPETSEVGAWWGAESGVGRVDNGMADRTHRLKATGNGQVPAVAAAAWNILTHDLGVSQ